MREQDGLALVFIVICLHLQCMYRGGKDPRISKFMMEIIFAAKNNK